MDTSSLRSGRRALSQGQLYLGRSEGKENTPSGTAYAVPPPSQREARVRRSLRGRRVLLEEIATRLRARNDRILQRYGWGIGWYALFVSLEFGLYIS